MLKDAGTETSTKIVKVSEGIADERDQLYSIEQFLKMPFQIKKCQCKVLSEEEKTQMERQIASIE